MAPLPGNSYSDIRHGDRVTIHSARQDGKFLTGYAVMKGPAGWVLNLGGKHGTSAVCSEENFYQRRPPIKPVLRHHCKGCKSKGT